MAASPLASQFSGLRGDCLLTHEVIAPSASFLRHAQSQLRHAQSQLRHAQSQLRLPLPRRPPRGVVAMAGFGKDGNNKSFSKRGNHCLLLVKKKVSDDNLQETRTLEDKMPLSTEYNVLSNKAPQAEKSNDDAKFLSGNSSSNKLKASPTRETVLQACILTSGLLFAMGFILRQVSHVASTEGWTTIDSCSEVTFNFEIWHIKLILGMVMFISSSRYILLKFWPDFSESSNTANEQILTALKPLDYISVAFFPGISEELLFRGTLMPLCGLDWKSALLIGAIFGGLHLGNGRRYSYAIWATFVGFAYGMAAIVSSSVIVPMASHSLNNLVGALIWRVSQSTKAKG